jgi:1-acyl-sn-glycerol-3-phosphate acyltransferase
LYPLGRSITNGVLFPIYQFRVIGKENLPSEGGVLLCTNHIHNFDPIVVGITSPRPIHFMAKEELFTVPILGKIMPLINAFPVKRGLSDRGALRKGLGILKEGNVLGLFPEGTRSKSSQVGDFKAGSLRIAIKSGVKVIPVSIKDSYKLIGKKGRNTPAKVSVHYSEPIDSKNFKDTNELAAEVLAQIKKHL